MLAVSAEHSEDITEQKLPSVDQLIECVNVTVVQDYKTFVRSSADVNCCTALRVGPTELLASTW